jgi:hypothetical protein
MLRSTSGQIHCALLVYSIFAAILLPPALSQTSSAARSDFTGKNTRGQEPEAKQPIDAAGTTKANDSPRIQDNSFLIEEAYNQEFGVVQHIQNFQRYWNSKSWIYTFTQEWPIDSSPRHQFSYTLAALHAGDQPASGAGFGDLFLNYRYQVLGNGEARVAFAPRFSVLLPTGDSRQGRGTGAVGVQGALPLSVVMSRKLVTHWNLGTTVVPSARNSEGATGTIFGYNLGQSFVWLAHPRFNVLLETVFIRAQQLTGPNTKEWTSSVLMNPGIRWSYNFQNGLQIVPGIGIPLGVGPSSGERGVFLYLSLEHPYRKLPEK